MPVKDKKKVQGQLAVCILLKLLTLLSTVSVVAVCSRCSKVLPLALGVYQDGLPPHYVRAVHLAKVSQCRDDLVAVLEAHTCITSTSVRTDLYTHMTILCPNATFHEQ